MKRVYFWVFVFGILVFLSPQISGAGEKIKICHFTGSEKNPYVEIEIDLNGLHGHSSHFQDVIPAPQEGCNLLAPVPL